jgi:hypothetical protein
VFWNRMLRKISGMRRRKYNEAGKNLHNKDLHD